MVTWFSLIFALVILQRLIELIIAKRNAAYIRSLGGYEVGAEHYCYIVAVHVLFFISLLTEVLWRGNTTTPPALLPFALFLIAQGLRVWCLSSLGRFWNTRIFVLPNSQPVVRGPYRFLRHPNYVVVALELLTLPLCFGAPLTAIVFTLLNAMVLRERIRVEEKALRDVTSYEQEMSTRLRFLPTWKR
jgi:methyltransferase